MDTSPNPQRRDHTGMPIDAIVAVTELNLSFGTLFKIVAFLTIAQALIAGLVIVALLLLGIL